MPADTSNNDHTFSEWRGKHLPVRTPEAARPADVGQCRRGAAERGRKGREVVWAVGAGIRVACEPRATLRSHVHRLEASYGRCCLRVPCVALFVVRVTCELQNSSSGIDCGSAGRKALCLVLVILCVCD